MTLIANTQGVHFARGVLAEALGLPAQKLRVVTPNVGGAFGVKIYAYPEQALVLLATRVLRRPVRWTCGRAEAFLADTQGRGHATSAAPPIVMNAIVDALKDHKEAWSLQMPVRAQDIWRVLQSQRLCQPSRQ